MSEIKEQPVLIPHVDIDNKSVDPGNGYLCNARIFLSQQGEDLEVYVDYFKDRSVENGLYIEAGAVEGWQASNTWYFEHNEDFLGTLVEANLACLEGLRRTRPFNTICIAALHDKDDETVSFTVTPTGDENILLGYIDENTTLRQKQTVQDKTGGETVTVSVPTVRLQTLIKKAEYSYVDILFLDVEGSELQALRGLDWTVPIYVVVIELPEGPTIKPDEKQKNEACRQILRDQGYIFNKYCGCNEIWHLPTYRDGKPTLIADWDKLESDNGETK